VRFSIYRYKQPILSRRSSGIDLIGAAPHWPSTKIFLSPSKAAERILLTGRCLRASQESGKADPLLLVRAGRVGTGTDAPTELHSEKDGS
jgi:hypothetical protein